MTSLLRAPQHVIDMALSAFIDRLAAGPTRYLGCEVTIRCPLCAEVVHEARADEPLTAAGVAHALGVPPAAFVELRTHQKAEAAERDIYRHVHDKHDAAELYLLLLTAGRQLHEHREARRRESTNEEELWEQGSTAARISPDGDPRL